MNDTEDRLRLAFLRLRRFGLTITDSGRANLIAAPAPIAKAWCSAVKLVSDDDERAFAVCAFANENALTNFNLSSVLRRGPLQHAARAGRLDDVRAMMPIDGLYDCKVELTRVYGIREGEQMRSHSWRMSPMHRIIGDPDYHIAIFVYLLDQSPPPTAEDLRASDAMGNTILGYALAAVAYRERRRRAPGGNQIDPLGRDIDAARGVVRRLIGMGIPVAFQGVLRVMPIRSEYGNELASDAIRAIPTDGTALFDYPREDRAENTITMLGLLAICNKLDAASHLLRAGLRVRCQLIDDNQRPFVRIMGVRVAERIGLDVYRMSYAHLHLEIGRVLPALARIISVFLMRPRREIDTRADRWIGDRESIFHMPPEIIDMLARHMAVAVVRVCLDGLLRQNKESLGSVVTINGPVNFRHSLALPMMELFGTCGAAHYPIFTSAFRTFVA
jgi:hypothetical protein